MKLKVLLLSAGPETELKKWQPSWQAAPETTRFGAELATLYFYFFFLHPPRAAE